MPLTEQRIVNAVTIKPGISAAEVQWKNSIFRDGVEVSFTYERKAYQKRTFTNLQGETETIDQSNDFLTEVDGASSYIAALGW